MSDILSLPYSRIASVPAVSLLGNDTGSARTAKALSAAEVTAFLDLTADVSGPASSTDNAIARFDSTTGKAIQNSTVTIDDSGNIVNSGSLLGLGAGGATKWYVTTGGHLSAAADANGIILGALSDLSVYRGGSDIWFQRRGLNAQTFLLAGTYTSTTSFECVALLATGAEYHLKAQKGASGGSLRNIIIGSQSNGFVQIREITDNTGVIIGQGGTNRVAIRSSEMYPMASGYNLGGSGAFNRWNMAYITGLDASGVLKHTGSTFGIFAATPATQPAAITDVSSGTDAAYETAINSILAALRTLGVIAT